jgi:hypothetical protein
MLVSLPWPSPARRIAGLAALLALAACSEEGSLPICENCEDWRQLTTGLGRFPEPHPTNAAIVVYSSVDKTPGATDANRHSDEDLWLSWVVDRDDPTANPVWQLTRDELGAGDNFQPRWSPAGDRIAFVHADAGGRLELWVLPVTAPATAADSPGVGTAEMITLGRDPAWASEDRIVFTRDAKLFAVDLSVPSPRGGFLETQLSFDPPVFASSDEFVDRHPDIAADGGAIFNALARENVADVSLEAFEVDNTVFPPDTTATDAFVLYQAPGGVASYPIFEGADTVRTPASLLSLPVGEGGAFRLGVRLDGRFLADTTRETYCDTTIVLTTQLDPGDSDTLRYYFQVARGTLRVTTMATNTSLLVTRLDDEAGIGDIAGIIQNVGEVARYPCLLSYRVVGGAPAPPDLATYRVSGTRIGSAPYDTLVSIPPGDSVLVTLYPAGPGIEEGALRPLPRASVVVSASGRSRPPDAVGRALSALRAAGDSGAVWRLHLEPTGARLTPVLRRAGLIQNPVLSSVTSTGSRYVAYVSDAEGRWDLYVQRLAVTGSGAGETWLASGDPVRIETPGSVDNLDCARSVFHPRFVGGAPPGAIRVLVAMSDCPDNGFEDLGFDDDPWAIGEVRVWQVDVPIQ